MAAIKKERIKDQMVNTAARIWGVEESEIEHNFDPLALLIIEACAAELEKIGHNITESHKRLIDYLAEIILPESLFGSVPASGILQAMPLDNSTDIDALTSFSLTQKIYRPATNSTESVDLNLTPIGMFRLFKAELAYMVSGNKLYRIKENNSRELIFSPEKSAGSNSIWLGISAEKMPDNLNGLSLYFDLRSHSAANSFYNSLLFAKCFVNGTPVEISSGFSRNEGIEINQKEILLSGDDRTNKLNRKTGYVYKNRFLQITGSGKIAAGGIPAAWSDQFPAEMIKKIEAEKLIFIKLEFQQNFPQEVFDIVTCSINAFPAVNKKLSSFSYKTDDWLNIIPIPVTGTFFDLASVKTEKGENYKIRPAAGANNLSAGEVIVRSGGVGKTSSQEVREMINNISETIRDQSAYFGQISNEIILNRLREIGKILAGLEDNINMATDKKSEIYYLMMRPKKNGEMVFINYWTTNAEDANNIKAGAAVNAVNNTVINSKKCSTLTSFSGGKNIISETEKKLVLRQQLLSGGKVVSAEDVKLLCAQLYGNKLKKADVQKAVQVSHNKAEGFNRTIDVLLTYSNVVNDSMKTEMDNLYRELEFSLQGNASPVYPFRIIINNTDQ
jgi:hypothetical protein